MTTRLVWPTIAITFTGVVAMSTNKSIIAVYQITNIVSKKFYIGSSSNLYERWRKHKNKLRKGTHTNPHLQASWDKHGEDCFKFEKLGEFTSIADMEAAEQGLIDTHWDDPLCMNLAKWVDAAYRGMVGELHHNYGKTLPDSVKAKISAATKKQWQTADPRTGTTHSTETKTKISAKVQTALAEGRGGKFIPTEETRAKMSKSLMGNTCALGVKRTDAEKAAIAERMTGNQNWLGKTHTEESKLKMSKRVVAFVDNDTGMIHFDSLTQALEFFDIKMPTLRRALKSGKPISKGKCAGVAFEYDT